MIKRNSFIAFVCVLVSLSICIAVSVADKNHNPDDKNHYDSPSTDTWITTPEYKTDTSRAIDAYERLMDRYMDSVEQRFTQLTSDSQSASLQLTSISAKLDDLSLRLSRIEKALGIDPNSQAPSKPKASKYYNLFNSSSLSFSSK